VTSFLSHYGVVAVFVLLAVDAVFPAASELVLVYGGALASGALTHSVDVLGGHTSGAGAYAAVVTAAILGYQLGAIAGWEIGRRGGRPLLDRHGRWFHLTPDRLDRADRWFERWDDSAALVGRVTPVARSFVSIPAGLFEMPFARYNVLTLAGNAVWCLALAGIGWGVGTGYKSFDHGFRFAEYAVVVGAVLLGAFLVVRRRRAATILRRHADSAR
jgi:membrane protein DedA with SNARE-associated domain